MSPSDSVVRFCPARGARAFALGIAFGLLLGACEPQQPTEQAASEVPTSGDTSPQLGADPLEAPASLTTPRVERRLPGAVTGTFDETQAKCSESLTMSRLVVSQDTLEFYYGYATVDMVTVRDSGYDVAATLYELEGVIEVVPAAITYRIEPRSQSDSLLFGAQLAGRAPSMLVRCTEP